MIPVTAEKLLLWVLDVDKYGYVYMSTYSFIIRLNLLHFRQLLCVEHQFVYNTLNVFYSAIMFHAEIYSG